MTDYTDPSVYGVVVAVYCPATKRFLLIREKYDKPAVYKRAGMLAFVSETSKLRDTDVLATVRRAVQEEIGLCVIADDDIFVREMPLTNFIHGVAIYAAWVVVTSEFIPEYLDDDVSFYGWVSLETIRRYTHHEDVLRIETIPVLDIVLRGRGGADA